MMTDNGNETNNDLEDTFNADNVQRKPKSRAIIDSEDSDESDAPNATNRLSDSDDYVDDSFDEDEYPENSSPSKQPKKREVEVDPFEDDSTDGEYDMVQPHKTIGHSTVDTTDDEEEEIIESSDLEDESPVKRDKTPVLTADESDASDGILTSSNRQNDDFVPQDYRDNHIEDSSDEETDSSRQNKISESSEDVPEIIEKSVPVVEVSSDEEGAQAPSLTQTDIKSFLINSTQPESKQQPPQDTKIVVSQAEYQEQVKRVNGIEADLLRAKNAVRIIKLDNLPDKGKSLLDREQALDRTLQEHKDVLRKMEVEEKVTVNGQNKIRISWHHIQAGVDAVGPRTFGEKGVARFNTEKQLTLETLDGLHKSLETCPTEKDIMDDPKGLKVPLMSHQKRALAWLLWREKQNPSGGLLADDMGLGKTLTMISLIMKARELGDEDEGKENYRSKYPGGTLVVSPASVMNQWSEEVYKRTKRGLLSVEVYHGYKREKKAKRLAQHDIVITTYAIVLAENEKNGPLFGVRWRRVILDEAHQIRNFKSKTAEAAFCLSAKSRWALTGTPVHNKELDMFAMLKFLRCSPFDDIQIWKRWVGDKSTGGEMRLHAVISSLMLRRTKAELIAEGSLQSLPDRTWELVTVTLTKDEQNIYQKVLIFSRTLFAQFLHQRAEKDQDAYNLKFTGPPTDPNGEYSKMRTKLLKMNRVKEVSQHDILVLILRLRQVCCHPCLIKQMMEAGEDLGDAESPEEAQEINLLEQLNKLTIDEDDQHPAAGLGEEGARFKVESKRFLNSSAPIFSSDYCSSKIEALVKLLKEKVANNDKAIIVSQWTSLLNIVAKHVKNDGITFDSLNGTIPVPKRMGIVDNFNDPNSDTKVLLLSLTAGGVGLNLIGANHLFLLDLHWNPQLESQAQDRIYRLGQKKPIFVYKFMAVETIEERIKALQDRKLEIADSMLTGSKRAINSKLTIQDMQMLFGFQ